MHSPADALALPASAHWQLESENGALKQHIQRLEAAAAGAAGPVAGSPGGGGGGGTPAGGMRLAQLEGENNLLKSKVAQLQKGSDRLQQVCMCMLCSAGAQLGMLLCEGRELLYPCCVCGEGRGASSPHLLPLCQNPPRSAACSTRRPASPLAC